MADSQDKESSKRSASESSPRSADSPADEERPESPASESEPAPGPAPAPASPQAGDRRNFLSRVSGVGAAGGLLLGYGAFAVTAGKYLYPAGGAPRTWMFVRELGAMNVGDSISFVGPQGESIAVARLASSGNADDFVALSTVCPHLGCQVSWIAEDQQFFCPCHNGIFDAAGAGVSGPPAKAGQSLSRYPLKIENDLLFIEVPAADPRSAADPPGADAIIGADGRDGCLGPQPERSRGAVLAGQCSNAEEES